MSIDLIAVRRALDHLIAAATELRDEFQRAEQAAVTECRLIAQAEAAALRDLAADDAELQDAS